MKPVLQLNLNRHPVDVPNGSLIMARNVRVSDDGKRLINEAGVVISSIVYENQVVGVIPTYKDLIVFTNKSQIFINEEIISSDWNWEGGEVFGTWTQNIEGEYIIAISERNVPDNKLVPLKVINISKDTKDGNETKYTITPTIPFYNLKFVDYVEGDYISNGTYYFYIRYEISNNNYTKWFPCSTPIYAYNTDTKNVLNYEHSNPMQKMEDGTLNRLFQANLIVTTGYINYESKDSNSLNFKFTVEKYSTDVNYRNFQIGFVLVTSTDVKAYSWEKFSSSVGEIIFNGANATEISINELQLSTFGVYNVQTMANYNNRLYIANYEESTKVEEFDTSNIDVTIEKKALDINIDNTVNIVYKGGILWLPKIISLQTIRYTLDYTKITTNIGDRFCVNIVDFWNVGLSQPNAFTDTFGTYINGDSIIKYRAGSGEQADFASNIYITFDTYSPNSKAKLVIKSGSTYNYLDSNNPQISIPNSDGSYYTRNIDNAWFAGSLQETAGDNIDFVNYGFSERIKNTTLIPGEVYNFFIHFVRTDGSVSKGYRINPKSKIISLPKLYMTIKDSNGNSDNVEWGITYDGSRTMKQLQTVITNLPTSMVGYPISSVVSIAEVTISQPLLKFYNDLCNKFANNKVYSVFGDYSTTSENGDLENYLNLTEFEDSGYIYNNSLFQIYTERGYSYYSNVQNDGLFVVKYYRIIASLNPDRKKAFQYYPKFTGITIPNGYIGFFISTEKYESRKSISGIATLEDFTGQEVPTKDEQYTKGLRIISNDLYSPDRSINGNILRFESRHIYKPYTDYITNLTYNRYISEIEYNVTIGSNIYTTDPIVIIDNKEILDGDNSADGNNGRERAIIVNKDIDISSYPEIDANTFYIVSFITLNDNLYTSKFKNLTQISNIKYKTFGSETYTYDIVDGYNLGEFISLARHIVVNQHGVSINTTGELNVVDTLYNYYYHWKNQAEEDLTYPPGSPYNIIEYLTYSKTLYELLEIKQDIPTLVVPFDLRSITASLGTKQVNIILPKPGDIQNLFEDTETFTIFRGNKVYDNYTGEEISVDVYDKFIRRSNIQQDESKEIAWRIFQPDAYKQITENRGKITNIVGVGLYLLVHCEYSLFMFNRDASLQTQNKNVQLYIPDAFDTEYQEIFTSSHGFGGLKDYTSWCLDDFGYIFYDSDRYQVLKFNEKNLDILDNGIELLLKEKKFRSCDFAVDSERKRLILSFTGEENGNKTNATISYSLLAEAFISTHNYYYSKAFNTANQLYIFTNNNFYIFEEDALMKGRIPIISEDLGITNLFPGLPDDNPRKYLSSINIVFNQYPEIIKTLVYINYLFNSSVYEGREGEIIPPSNNEVQNKRNYSGDKLIITTEGCSSGELDLSILTDNTVIAPNKFMNYNKPRWNGGMWSFNAFRNINVNPNSYIYGKYFSLDFRFINNVTDIEIEAIEVYTKQFK